MKNAIIVLAIIIVTYSGCITPPSYDKIPAIEFLSISSTNIVALQDTLTIRFSFTDGDGDLGFKSFDAEDCNLCSDSCRDHPTFGIFLRDSRTNCLKPFNIPFVPDKGSSDDISGVVTVFIFDIFCLPSNGVVGETGPADTLTYTIEMKDRAGHFSNVIETPDIFIKCF